MRVLRCVAVALVGVVVLASHSAALKLPSNDGTMALGEDCECPHDCWGNGACVNGVCKCSPGWTYYDCSLRICPSTCSNHGFCFNGTCHCHTGWAGVDCDQPACKSE